jgi:hypothetical protein
MDCTISGFGFKGDIDVIKKPMKQVVGCLETYVEQEI